MRRSTAMHEFTRLGRWEPPVCDASTSPCVWAPSLRERQDGLIAGALGGAWAPNLLFKELHRSSSCQSHVENANRHFKAAAERTISVDFSKVNFSPMPDSIVLSTKHSG